MERFGHFDLHMWHKVNPVPFVNNTWLSDLEYIFLGWKTKRHAKVPMRLKSKLFQSGIDTENLHPTQKPVQLIEKYIRVLDCESVIDPFMGSGTTLVAAKNLGRKAIGIEVEEKYCEIAAERLRQEVLELEVR
jgi:site-specific DNA-methyltransferase (adenine-specific)